MAFNLQKVLRALLFSSSQPLSVKDIQNLFARFHEQTPPARPEDEDAPPTGGEGGPDAALPPEPEQDEDEAAPANTGLDNADSLPAAAEEEAAADSPEDHDAELYEDVPSLITGAQIRETMDAISEELRATNDIYLLIEGPSGYRVVTHPRFARWIRILRDEPPPVKLTQSAIETLAIIAYRQPVTRTDIETIRGVSAEAGLNKLLERELIYIMGRADLPGRPLQYGTTDKFLDFVGVKSLVELPASDVLSPRQIDEWLKNTANARPPADADMGLPLEEGEGGSPNRESVTVDQPAASAGDEPPPTLSRPPIPVADDNDEAGDTAPADEPGEAADAPPPPPESAPPGTDAGDEGTPGAGDGREQNR